MPVDPSLAQTILRVFLTAVFALILWGGLDTAYRTATKLLHRQGTVGRPNTARLGTLLRLVRHLLEIVLGMLTAAIILEQLGVGVGPILAGAGILGATIGLGIQPAFRDCITGATLILEDRLRVGETVQVNGAQGIVEEVNLRTTVLRDWDGTLHIFPNRDIAALSNLSREWTATILTIPVGLNEDIDRALRVLQTVATEMGRNPKWGSRCTAIDVLGPEQVHERNADVQVRIVTAPTKHWGASREFNRRALVAFRREGIAHSNWHSPEKHLLDLPTVLLPPDHDHARPDAEHS